MASPASRLRGRRGASSESPWDGPTFATFVVRPDEAGVRRYSDVPAEELHRCSEAGGPNTNRRVDSGLALRNT